MALGFGLFHCRRSGTHEGMSTVVCRSIATAFAAAPHFVARQRPRNECQRLSAHAKAFSVTRRMAVRGGAGDLPYCEGVVGLGHALVRPLAHCTPVQTAHRAENCTGIGRLGAVLQVFP